MTKAERSAGTRKDLVLIYRMMFRYWYILVSGLLAMFFYALFNGFSITLAIPLFDYVFKSGETRIDYSTATAFLERLGEVWREYATAGGGLFSLRSLNDLAPFWTELKDVMLHTSPIALLNVLCLFLVAAILLKNIFYFIQKVLFIQLRGRTIRDLRERIFHGYMEQSLEFHNGHQVGDAIVRMVNDVEIVSEQYLRAVLEGVRDLVSILVFARIAYLLNQRLFFYSIVILPVFTLLVGALGKKVRKYSKRLQAQLSSMFSAVEEALSSMKIVKAFRREETEKQNFREINRKHLRMWQRSLVYSSLSLPISEMNTVLTGVIVILLGGRMILDPGSGFSVGDFTAFLFALFSMLHPLKMLSQLYTEIKKALVSLDRISQVLHHEPAIRDASDAHAKAEFLRDIEFNKVSFEYQPGKQVLRDVTLSIRKGEKVAFVGVSGGGKTTLANLFNRMYDVTEGEIKLDGEDIRHIRLNDLRRLFGVVTQDSVLFTRSVRENIVFGSLEPVSEERLRSAARISHCEEFIAAFPNGYDEVLQTKGSNLSGGQRQRLCIARAIVGDPPILILDEATSQLDSESEKLVQLALDEAMRNRTVIMIAHRLSTILEADKIVVLEQGQIVGLGRHEELLQRCPRYQSLYATQYGER